MPRILLVPLLALALSACSSDHPRIIQPSANDATLHLTSDMASQVEIPASEGQVESVVVGDPSLIVVDRSGNIISLAPKGNRSGVTNLIVHTVDEDGNTKIHKYFIEVE